MKYLIDTHILFWHAEDNPRLSSDIKNLIDNPLNEIWVSHASIWEMTIKISLGKLNLAIPLDMLEEALLAQEFRLLNFDFSHYLALKTLPFNHQDPFDRMIIAQANAENMTIITADNKFSLYNIPVLLI